MYPGNQCAVWVGQPVVSVGTFEAWAWLVRVSSAPSESVVDEVRVFHGLISSNLLTGIIRVNERYIKSN